MANIVKQIVLLRNLSWITGKTEIKNYFSKFGNVTSCSVFYNKDTGLSTGYGVVQFSDEKFLDVIFKTEHIIDGKTIKLKQDSNYY